MNDNVIANVWRRLLERFTPGEMTVHEWCDQQGVSTNQYYYWRRRLKAANTATPQNENWLAVEVLDPTPIPTTPSGVSVRIAVAAIELQSGFDPAMLRAVVAALGGQPC